MKSFYLTDVGKVRSHNEDSVVIIKNNDNEYLMAVADGMGGHSAGEVASSIAISYLSKKFSEDGYGMIGIIADGDTKSKDAKEIIKATGVTYPNICLNEDLQRLLQIQVTPTTYFVDKKGNILGDPIYGARKESQYKYELESRLSLIE